MHFEILIEDLSGKKALDILIPKILNENHSYIVRSYKGVGRIPKDLKGKSDPSKRALLNQLPRLLKGYGKTFSSYPDNYSASVVLICDLDNKCLKEFKAELQNILDQCEPKPIAGFCIAIEEGEAWLLGDLAAVKSAYPSAKMAVLNSYENDSICGTWEKLADAVYPGGLAQLLKRTRQEIGKEKSVWAEKIAPFMDVHNNSSPSFNYFLNKIIELADQAS